MSNTSSISFKPSVLLEGINLARRAITKFTSELDNLATEVTNFIGKTGDNEKSLGDLSSRNRALAKTMLARDLDPTNKFISQPVSARVNDTSLNDDQKKIAEYLHSIYSPKKATGTKKPTLFREFFHKLDMGDFDESKLKSQLSNFKILIDQQEAYHRSHTGENPLPGIDLEGVKAGSSEDSGERRSILFTQSFFQTLKHKFKDNIDDIDLSKLKDYKLAVVDFLLGTVPRYYESGNRRKESITSNLNAPNGYLMTLVKAIDYFLKLK